MIIDQLPALPLPVDDADELPIERGQLTFKISKSDLLGDMETDIGDLQSDKQELLISGTNIKTVNGTSVLGSGNIEAIPSGGNAGEVLVKSSADDYAAEWEDIKETTQTLTPAVTKTTGSSEIGNVFAVRYGNIIALSIEIRSTASTSTGSNMFEGTLSGIPLPAVGTNGSGYYGTTTLTGSLEPDGTIAIRVTSANRASSTVFATVRWTYICN